MGSKPFSPPTQPFNCAGYRRKGTAGDIGSFINLSAFRMDTAESARAPMAFHPPLGILADQPGLVMSGSAASSATAMRRTPESRSLVAQRSVSPTWQIVMSLMRKSRLGPNQQSELRKAMGDLPKV